MLVFRITIGTCFHNFYTPKKCMLKLPIITDDEEIDVCKYSDWQSKTKTLRNAHAESFILIQPQNSMKGI